MTIIASTGKGHFALLTRTSKRPSSAAGFITGYMNTGGKCLEMFYRPIGNADKPGTLTVYVIPEDAEQSEMRQILSLGNY